MAKEIGKEAIEKQMEVMEEQQQKAQEFIDKKVCPGFVTKTLRLSVYILNLCTFFLSISVLMNIQ